MLLADIISPRRIFTDLKAAPKTELLREMTRRLYALGEVDDPEELARILIKREELITTAVKPGFAFPHAFSPQLKELSLTIGVIRGGTDYQSLDGSPVEFVFLLLGPPQRQDIHLRVLARLSRITAEEGMLDALREAADEKAIMYLMMGEDRRMIAGV
ncbi:PTS sugar transporter subunit IIA [Candidatus Sumerlaeota bacterium]|nr:PTS sugar transporter subunit IIA [Candidatus Sumerlaeota bacterium]